MRQVNFLDIFQGMRQDGTCSVATAAACAADSGAPSTSAAIAAACASSSALYCASCALLGSMTYVRATLAQYDEYRAPASQSRG